VGWSGTILATTDGGKSWETRETDVTALLSDVAFQPDGAKGNRQRLSRSSTYASSYPSLPNTRADLAPQATLCRGMKSNSSIGSKISPYGDRCEEVVKFWLSVKHRSVPSEHQRKHSNAPTVRMRAGGSIWCVQKSIYTVGPPHNTHGTGDAANIVDYTGVGLQRVNGACS